MDNVCSMRFRLHHPMPPSLTPQELKHLVACVNDVFDYAHAKDCAHLASQSTNPSYYRFVSNILGMLGDFLGEHYGPHEPPALDAEECATYLTTLQGDDVSIRIRWARCPVCDDWFRLGDVDTVSNAYLWQATREDLMAWIQQHGHAARASDHRAEMERWMLGYRETQPYPFEKVELDADDE